MPAAPRARPSDDAGHWANDPNTHCALYRRHLAARRYGQLDRDCKEGRGEGPGTASFFNNGTEFESFTGNFSGGVAADGHVTVRWGEGWSYEGDMVAGHFEGQASLINDKKDRFEGGWKDGKLNGEGSVAHDDGSAMKATGKTTCPTAMAS